jgi:hypothetical protein
MARTFLNQLSIVNSSEEWMTMGMDKLLHLLSTVSWKNFCASSALEAKIDHSGSPAEGVREFLIHYTGFVMKSESTSLKSGLWFE